MNKKKVLIVGAGMGGLSTALRLSAKGYQVEILEKNKRAGGRLNQVQKNGFTFDTGPSFFSMSYEFEELARDAGIKLPFEYIELDPLYTVNFRDGRKFKLYKDIDKLTEQFVTYEPDFKQKFLKYMKKCEALFNDTVDLAIKQNFNNLADYFMTMTKVNLIHLPILLRSFWQQVNRYFDSDEVKQVLSLVAFFLGRTPFDTNSVYTILSYTEFKHDGYYNVKGGMYKIVEGLVNELEKANVKFNYNTEIKGFNEDNGKLVSLIDQNSMEWKSDVYLINSDAAWFRGKIFNRRSFSDAKLSKKNWTLGYLTVYLGIKRKLPEVEHHNYYLGDNYEKYNRTNARNRINEEKPYYYVNVISKYNPDCAPKGHEALFFVCPVPNLLHKTNWSDTDEIANNLIDDFSKRINIDIQQDIVSKTVFTPETWKDKFNLFMGSGLGLTHSMNQIGGFRPANIDEKFNNVFYVGASTIPGTGLPMTVISSKLVTERIVKDFSV